MYRVHCPGKQQIGLSKNDSAMETTKSLLEIPTGLKGFKPETEQNIFQHIFTEIQKFSQNSLCKSLGKNILCYCFLYSQNNPQNHSELALMAYDSGNSSGSHATQTAGPNWSHVSGQESISFNYGRWGSPK